MTARGSILSGYHGHVDAVEPVLAGWVAETARPAAPVGFIVAIDRDHRIAVRADRARPDVAAAGLAAANCGFSLALPERFFDGTEHRLDLLLPDGRSLNLPGSRQTVALGPVNADVIAAGAADLDAVLDLLRRNDGEAGYDPEAVGPANAAAFNALGSPDRGFLHYARVGDRLVGYSRLDRGRGEAAEFGIVALTVLEAYRRKGLGDALMRALLHAAREAPGLREVWLSVRSDNIPAIRLYEKLGFRFEATRPSGEWVGPGELTMVWLPD